MRRREFTTLIGGAALSWPLPALAQRAERMRRIGVLMGYGEGDREGQAFVAEFREELRNLGWIEGSNAAVDVRWGAGNEQTMQRFAADLVALKPDLILSHSTAYRGHPQANPDDSGRLRQRHRSDWQ